MGYKETSKQVIDELAAILTAEPIETKRLRLRPFRESDLPDLFEYLSQPEQRRLSGNCLVESLDDARLVLEHIMDPTRLQGCYAVVLKDENKVIGSL